MTLIQEYWSRKLGIKVVQKEPQTKPVEPSANHLVSQYLRDKDGRQVKLFKNCDLWDLNSPHRVPSADLWEEDAENFQLTE